MRSPWLSGLVFLASTASVLAQSMTSIVPNYGPNNGGATLTITGSGFSMTPKATRFVDSNGVDIFTFVSCSSTTSCTGSPRAGLVLDGQKQAIQVFARVGGLTSGSFATYHYYGAPKFTSVVPSTVSPSTGASGVAVNGGFFTSGSANPGPTSIYMYTSINDFNSGCPSTAQCTFNAPAICGDLSANQGAYYIDIRSPGGNTNGYLTYGTLPATPSITSFTPSSGPAMGGNTVTIQGTNFRSGASGTLFTFNVPGPFPVSNSVNGNCSSTTTCTVTMPPGGLGGFADVTVNVASAPIAAGCASNPNRSANALPFTKTAGYAYTGINEKFSAPLFTSENGGTATFSIALNSQPTAGVHVALNATGGRGVLSATGLDFTTGNWQTPQSVTVTGIDDTGVGGAAAPGTGNLEYTVSVMATSTDANYNNVNGADIHITNVDNDTGQYFITPQAGLITTEAGGSATFTVVLTKAPTATVTLSLVSNDPLEGTVSPSSLTFSTTTGGLTGWNVPRTVTVTGVDDGVADGPAAYEIIITASTSDAAYQNPPNVSVTNTTAAAVTLHARGDFQGDGKADLMWRNSSSGTNSMWLMSGASIAVSASLPPVADPNFKVVGIGDFQGDGKADVLWRNSSTGANVLWLMDGPSVAVSVLLPTVADPNWTVAGVGDFQGDGKADIFWRNTASGDNSIWLMDGGNVAVTASLPTVGDPNFKVVGIGDFQADGKDDVLWRNSSTGANVQWLMNGTSVAVSTVLTTVADLNWKVAGLGDFQGDGKADIMWRNSVTGDNAVWFVNGTSVALTASLTSVPDVTWAVARIADFQGDGKADIIWRNTVSGSNSQWLMSGAMIAVNSSLTPVPDVNFKIAGAP